MTVTIEQKFCFRCKETKPYVEFAKNKNRRGGISTYCKACIKVYNFEYGIGEKTKAHKER